MEKAYCVPKAIGMEERIMRLTEQLCERDNELSEMIKKLSHGLEDPPGGSLRVSAEKGKPKYYIRNKTSDRLGKYVRKNELYKAAALAQRDYDMEVMDAAIKEQAAIKTLIDLRENNLPEDIFNKLILPRKNIVTSGFLSDEEYAEAWLVEPYTPKGFEKGSPEYYSTDGTRVRSKSEIILADILDSYSIPRKFECPLKLWNGKTIHPDFTLLNVRERKEFIWEHLGMADDPGYMRYNVKRLNDLIRSGYYPGINLILSIETSETPLDSKIVHALINKFLL